VDDIKVKDGSDQLVMFIPEEDAVLRIAAETFRIPVYGYHSALQKGDSIMHHRSGVKGVLVSIIRVAQDNTSSSKFEVGYWGGTLLIGSFVVIVEANQDGQWSVKEMVVRIRS